MGPQISRDYFGGAAAGDGSAAGEDCLAAAIFFRSRSTDAAGREAPELDSSAAAIVRQQQLHIAEDPIYSAPDLRAVREGFALAWQLFEGVERRWGPQHVMPHFAHMAEVGMLLMAAGQRPELVAAGYLHDAFEDYTGAQRAAIEARIRKVCGAEVAALVEAVTEPDRTVEANDWLTCKRAVLEKVEGESPEAAAIVCASKISTIACGNEFLAQGRPVTEWSRAAGAENLRLFREWEELFARKGVPEVLQEQFRREVDRFAAMVDGSSAPRKLSPQGRRILAGRKALELCWKEMGSEQLAWGEQQMPRIARAAETAALLQMAGVSGRAVIVGALLEVDPAKLTRRRPRGNGAPLRRGLSQLGESVSQAAQLPPIGLTQRGHDSRQLMLLKVQHGTREAAAVSCAFCISELGRRNSLLRSYHGLTRQIELAAADDLILLHRLVREFEKKGVPQLLLDEFCRERDRFETETRIHWH